MSLNLIRSITLLVAMVVSSSPMSWAQSMPPGGRRAVEVGPPEGLMLPPPFATPSARNRSKVIGWPQGRMPAAPSGFTVSLFADNIDNPRQPYVLSNGDVAIVESIRESSNRPEERSGNRITLFRDTNKDGRPDLRETFVTGLNMPFGKDKRDAKDPRRAAILEVNPDGTGMRVFASGLRIPVGMDWEPKTNVLWTVVNERDGLGDELVPDYLTSVKEGAFYG